MNNQQNNSKQTEPNVSDEALLKLINDEFNQPISSAMQPGSPDPACGLVDDFINHINQHIANQPVGGYDAEQSRVAITVGSKTFEFYDHAALMQSLLDSLEYLKTEL
jgi:hypothetical protein